jgi:tetratricopeptide (TPR) repeat protein
MKNFSELLVRSEKNKVSAVSSGVSSDNFENSEKKLFFSWDSLIVIPLYLIVFVTPFFFLPWGVYFVSFNKQFLVLFLALLSLFGYLGKSLNEGKIVYKKNNLFLILFSVSLLISLFFSDSRNVSLFGFDGGEIDSFINLLSFIIIFFISSSVINEKNIKTIVSLVLSSSAILLFIQIVKLFGLNIFLFDFTKDINFNSLGVTILPLGLFLSAQLVFAVSILVTQNNISNIKKIFLSVFTLLGFIYIFALNVKEIWLLLIFSLVFIFLFKISSGGGEIRSKSIGLVIACLSLAIFFYVTNFPSILSLSKNTRGFSQEFYVSAPESLRIVKHTWFSNIKSLGGVKDFVFGAGGGNFGYEYLNGRSKDTNLSNSNLYNVKFNSGFSLFITYLVTFGLLGAILFLFFILQQFLFVAKRILQGNKDLLFPLLVFSFYFIVNIFAYNVSYVLFLTSFLILGALKALTSEEREINLFTSPQRNFVLSLVIVAGMMFSLFAIYYDAARLIASFYYSSGVKTFNQGKIKEGIKKVVNATMWDSKNDFYYRGLSSLYLNKILTKEGDKDDRQISVELAQQAIKLNPVDSVNHLNLAKIHEVILEILNDIKDKDKTEDQKALINASYELSLQSYITAAELDLKNPEKLLAIAQLNFIANKTKEAKEYIKKSLDLKINFDSAYFLLAQILEKEGLTKEAIEENKKAKFISPYAIGVRFQLGVLYYRNGQFNDAKNEFEYIISQIPNQANNARVLQSLALTYDKLGEKTKALEALKKVLSFNPGNAEIEKEIDRIKGGESSSQDLKESKKEGKKSN